MSTASASEVFALFDGRINTTSASCRGSRPSWALVGAGCSNQMQVAQGQGLVRDCALVQAAIGCSILLLLVSNKVLTFSNLRWWCPEVHNWARCIRLVGVGSTGFCNYCFSLGSCISWQEVELFHSIHLPFTFRCLILQSCERDKWEDCLSIWSLLLFILHVCYCASFIFLALLARPPIVISTALLCIFTAFYSVHLLAILFTFVTFGVCHFLAKTYQGRVRGPWCDLSFLWQCCTSSSDILVIILISLGTLWCFLTSLSKRHNFVTTNDVIKHICLIIQPWNI